MTKKRIYFLIVSLGIILFMVSALSTIDFDNLNESSIVKSDVHNIAVEAPAGPVAEDDAYETYEDSVLAVDAASGVMANDIDPNGDILSIQVITEPSHGALSMEPDGSFIYTPASNWFGVDSFEYEVSDGVLTASATASITVYAVNDPAVAVDDYVVTDEDTPVLIDYIANDYDPDGEPFQLMEYQYDENDLHGTIEYFCPCQINFF